MMHTTMSEPAEDRTRRPEPLEIDGGLAEDLRRAAAVLGREPEELLREMTTRGLGQLLTRST